MAAPPSYAWPVTQVQIEFVAGTWTTIGGVTKVSATRGRQYELQAPQAGSLTITVDNSSGFLDPDGTGSPYAPNVQLGKRIQLVATLAGSSFTLWTGYVERYPQRWGAGGNHQWTDLVAVDIFAVLAQQILEPIFYEEVKLLNPLAWYPLDDAPGSVSAGQLVVGERAAGLYRGINYDFGIRNLSLGVATTAPGVKGRTQAQFALPTAPQSYQNLSCLILPGAAAPPLAAPWTVVIGMKAVVGAHTALGCLWGASSEFHDRLVHLYYGPVNGVNGIYAAFNAAGYYLMATMPDDGQDHLIALSCAADGHTLYVSVDGTVTAAGIQLPFVVGSPYSRVFLGAYRNSVNSTTQNNFVGTLSNYLVFGTDLIANPSNPLSAYGGIGDAYSNADYGHVTSDRFLTIRKYSPLPSGQATNINTGDSAMGLADLNGKTVAQAMIDVGTTESGTVYVDKTGSPTLVNRHARYNPVPGFTFGERAGEYPYENMALDHDTTHLANTVTVTQTNGIVAKFTTAASVAKYGTRTLNLTLDVYDAQQAVDAAAYLAQVYSEAGPRVSGLVLNMAAMLAASGSPPTYLLGLELNAAVTINRRPGAGVTSSRVCWVEHLAYTIDFASGVFTIAVQLSPADENHYFIPDDPVYGRLDAGNRFAY